MITWWKRSLKVRLVVSVCGITLLTTLLLAQAVGHISREQISRDQGQLLFEVVREMAHALDQDLASRIGELRLFTHAASLLKAQGTTTQEVLLQRIKQTWSHYAWIGMTDANGTIITGTDGLLVGKNVAQRSWFKGGRKGLYLGDAHDAFLLARLMPKPVWDDLPLRLVDVAMPIFGEDGTFRGVVCGHLSWDWAFEVRQRLLGLLGNEGVELVLLNREGKVMVGSPSLPSLSLGLAEQTKVWREHQPRHEATVETWPDQQRYLTSIYIADGQPMLSALGWTVVARKLEQQAFSPAYSVQHKILLLGSVSALLLVLVVWWFIYRQLYALGRISAAANRVRLEQTNGHIPHMDSSDELGVFTRSLTSLVQVLQRRNDQLRLINRVFEESAQVVVITDADFRIIRVNAAFSRITGYDEQNVLKKTPRFLRCDKHSKAFYNQLYHAVKSYGCWAGELWTRCRDDSVTPQYLTVYSLQNEAKEAVYYIGLLDDLREQKRQQKRLWHLANYDVLTDLPNRHALQQRIAATIGDAQPSQCALLFLDLNRFKNINDTMGHSRGDMVLQELAGRLQRRIRPGQTLARWGGDEFVLFAANSNRQEAITVGQQLLKALNLPFKVDERQYHIGASIGVALYPEHSHSVEGLLRCADTAMYHAKHEEGNGLSIYAPWMNKSLEDFLRLDHAMRRAMRQGGDGFHLCYQPQFSLDGTTIHGAEVLVRWHDDDIGVQSPADFIPVAEKTGQILVIGQWIIEQALRDLQQWQRAGYCIPLLSLNCSTKQLQDDGFIPHLRQCCEDYDVAPSRIRIEVTESAIMQDEARALASLAALRKHGFTLSIDDFGTGYSSLHYLQVIKPDELKIDRSFVIAMEDDEYSRHIVNFSIDLAHSMGMDVVIEGVEALHTLTLFEGKGDLAIQGYVFSKPLDMKAFSNRMMEHRLLC